MWNISSRKRQFGQKVGVLLGERSLILGQKQRTVLNKCQDGFENRLQ